MGNIVATTWDVFGCNFPHFSTNTGRKGGSPQSLNYVIVQTNVVICGMDLFENGIYIYIPYSNGLSKMLIIVYLK